TLGHCLGVPARTALGPRRYLSRRPRPPLVKDPAFGAVQLHSRRSQRRKHDIYSKRRASRVLPGIPEGSAAPILHLLSNRAALAEIFCSAKIRQRYGSGSNPTPSRKPSDPIGIGAGRAGSSQDPACRPSLFTAAAGTARPSERAAWA